MSSTTLVLGAGFGGLACARELRRRLPASHRIVVIDRAPDFVVGATKTWVMLGLADAAAVRAPRRDLLPAGVELVQGEIRSIDPVARRVETAAGDFTGDALVIALGAELDPAAVPGFAEHARSFYTLEDAERLAPELARFDRGTLALLVPRVPFKCPPAPYEAAILVHDALVRRGVRERVTLEFWTCEPAPMPTAGAGIGRMVMAELERRGIAYRPGRATQRIEAGPKVVFADGEAGCDLLLAVPPHVAPRVVREAGLAPGGWIAVDPATLRVQGRGDAPLWAIGDVSSVGLPGRWKPEVPLSLPKAGVFAAAEGEVAAAQVAAHLGAGAADRSFDAVGFCYLELGGGMAMRADGDFFATPAPRMNHGDPGPQWLDDKRRWIEQWLGRPLALRS